MLRSILAAVSIVLCATVVSSAQPAEQRTSVAMTAPKNNVRVQISMNFFVSAPTSDPSAAVKAQEQARRTLYESAARECEVLLAVIASECRLESINVNMNRNYGQQQPEGFNANGNFAFHITMK